MARLIDDAHSAVGNFVQNFVIAEMEWGAAWLSWDRLSPESQRGPAMGAGSHLLLERGKEMAHLFLDLVGAGNRVRYFETHRVAKLLSQAVRRDGDGVGCQVQFRCYGGVVAGRGTFKKRLEVIEHRFLAGSDKVFAHTRKGFFQQGDGPMSFKRCFRRTLPAGVQRIRSFGDGFVQRKKLVAAASLGSISALTLVTEEVLERGQQE